MSTGIARVDTGDDCPVSKPDCRVAMLVIGGGVGEEVWVEVVLPSNRPKGTGGFSRQGNWGDLMADPSNERWYPPRQRPFFAFGAIVTFGLLTAGACAYWGVSLTANAQFAWLIPFGAFMMVAAGAILASSAVHELCHYALLRGPARRQGEPVAVRPWENLDGFEPPT